MPGSASADTADAGARSRRPLPPNHAARDDPAVARRPLPSERGAAPDWNARLRAHNDILDLIVREALLEVILDVVTAMVEREISGSRASILLLDDDGVRIRVGAGPSLPPDFHAAVEGAAIGPAAGTCGTAAYEKRVVITPSIADDPAWAEWKPAADAAGLAACWSTPFVGGNDRVLGTFAVYFAEPREPEDAELALLHDAGYLAAVAVHHDTLRRQLRETGRTHQLTGIPNRVVLSEELRRIEAETAETGQRFAVIQVAVDGMSPINESLGPTVGDGILRATADRLTGLVSDLVSEVGVAAHLWGCDFVVLVGGLADDDAALATAERVRDVLTEPLVVEGMTLVVDVTLGVSVYGGEVLDGPRPTDEPLRTANVALERAKADGNRQIGVYDPKSDPGADVLLLGPALRRGLDEEELTLAYQPVVTLADDRVDHYEALLRWITPSGTVSPSSFVPVAEHTGLVSDLGRYVLTRALAELGRQRAAGHDVGMSVNLSVRQLSDADLPELIGQLLAENGLPPASVTMEVTEGVLLSARAAGWHALSRIKDLGVHISLDDFGTGFNQVPYLRRFPFDEIKIDQSFVHAMNDHIAALGVIAGTIAFARTVGMRVVAEGIERRDQARQLLDLGVTHGQGYLFGAAMPAPSFE
ncbi:MAG: hypothetical protein QOH52_3889 [Pseudonocardiales bacterium]|nr:hypothetical protein [Pseudonocardiales bacterium]